MANQCPPPPLICPVGVVSTPFWNFKPLFGISGTSFGTSEPQFWISGNRFVMFGAQLRPPRSIFGNRFWRGWSPWGLEGCFAVLKRLSNHILKLCCLSVMRQGILFCLTEGSLTNCVQTYVVEHVTNHVSKTMCVSVMRHGGICLPEG